MFKYLRLIIICSIFLLCVCTLLNEWSEEIVFSVVNSNPKHSEISNKKINTMSDPIQVDLPEFTKMFKVYTHQKTYFIEPKAKYSISGRVLSKNRKFGSWVSRTDFDLASPIDIVLGWSDVSDVKLFKKNVSFLKQTKTINGGRRYSFWVPGDSAWSVDYVASHTSHNHIIPGSNNVMAILLKIKKYDVVKMTGYLVDVYKDGETVAWTSLSRYDEDTTSRGWENGKPGGSCEVFYVQSVQVGDKVYK